MKARTTIFDSGAEQELFHALDGWWEPDYRLYPHVPFTSLVEAELHELDAAEHSFLHKTTVDYVLTARDGRPLLGIEFDGLVV